ncbi:hypothetical protein HK101_002713 [Irineochytrium annulatum]|nr:hypothetical protein HK101_002713 [Irineochytrium annulatum]
MSSNSVGNADKNGLNVPISELAANARKEEASRKLLPAIPIALVVTLIKYLKSPKEWVLVIAVPRSDFFGNIDKMNKNVLIIAICVSVGGIALTALVSFLSLRPLSVLVQAMGLLTKLDFTALEGNILEARSSIAEVRQLQVTFSTMCKAFASGLRKNKELVTGHRASDMRTNATASSNGAH